MAVDDEETSPEANNPANTNRGENKNSMENVQAGESVTQNIEHHQHNRVGNSGIVINDPRDRNGWVNLCETLSQLPYFESVVVPSFVTAGGLGFVGSALWILMQSPLNGVSGGTSSIQTVFLLVIVSGFLFGISMAYLQTDKDSKCPECGERFALRTEEVRKTDETESERGTIIHGERDRECRECGYFITEVEEWTPDDFSP